MFEKLIEKILLSRLGNYIVDLDKEQLKVALWSGDITLENVYLKPETLLKMDLPLKIRFGKIKKLLVKVPWTRLSSVPVEILVEELYAIVEPFQPEDWVFSEETELARRKECINSVDSNKQQERKSMSSADDQKGFVERLTAKILDNLKVTVNNIHVRYEHNLKGRKFSMGLTLESIDCFTTNANWEKEFIDHPEVHKIIQVSRFTLYWISNDPETLAQADESTQIHRMKEIITNSADNILCPMNIELRVVHRSAPIDQPSYSISMTLPEIVMKYQQRQFHDTVKLFEFFTEYNKFLLKAEHGKKFKAMSPEVKTPRALWKFAIHAVVLSIRQRKDRTKDYFRQPVELNERNFKIFHRKILKGTDLAPSEQAVYDKIVYLSDMDDLLRWTEHVVSVTEKEPPRKSWFAFWRTSTPTTSENYDDLFPTVETDRKIFNKSTAWLEFSFILAEGRLELSKVSSEGVEEGIRISYKHFMITSKLKMQGSDSSASIQDILYASFVGKNERIVSRRLDASEVLPLWKVDLRVLPFELDCAASLVFFSQPMEIWYSKEILSQCISLFVVPSIEDTAKVAAWDTLQVFQDTTQEALMDMLYGETKFLIKADICGPRIYIPAPDGNFVVSLGTLTVNNHLHEDNFERINFQSKDLSLQYLNELNTVDIIPKFAIKASLSIIKKRIKKQKWTDDPNFAIIPDIIMRFELPMFSTKLSPSIFQKLKNITESFQVDDQTWSAIALDKEEIMRQSKLSGQVTKMGNNVQNWSVYFSVLSGPYLYFFDSESDENPSTYFYVKDCNIVKHSDFPNTLRLMNRHGECTLSFPDEDTSSQWLTCLHERIISLQSFASAAKQEVPQSTGHHHWVHIHFDPSNFSFTLSNEEGTSLTEIALSEIKATCQARPFDLNISSSLKAISVSDSKRKSSEHFTSLFKSLEGISSIEFDCQLLGKKSPDYAGEDCIISTKFGRLELNWNPDQLATMILYFQVISGTEYKSSPSVGMIQPNHVLARVNIDLVRLDLYLNLVETELMLAQFTVEGANTGVLVKNGGYEVNCQFANIEVFDLTNYPKTTITHSINPYKLLSRRDDSDSLLKFYVFVYTNDNPEKPDYLGSIVNVEMSSVSITYIHQPFMRIIDYVNYKILGILDYKMIVRDADHWSPIFKLSSLLNFYAPPEVCELRNFAQVHVKIDNPLLILRPRPYYEDYFVVDLGQIEVTSTPHTSSTRHASEEIWTDWYDVRMENMHITSGGQQVLEDACLQLLVERPLLRVSQEQIPDIDRSYMVSGSLPELKFTLCQADFMLLLQLSDLNLAYDDKLDHLISQCPPIQESKDPNHGGVFIKLDLNFELISFLLTHEEENIIELFFGEPNLQVTKYNDYSMDLHLSIGNFLGLVTEEKAGKGEISDRAFDETFEVPIERTRLPRVILGPLIRQPEVLKIDFNMSWDGNKNVIIMLYQCKFNFHIALFLQIQNFFYYGIPDYTDELETPFDYLSGNFAFGGSTETQYLAPRISVNVSMTNPIVTFPGSYSHRMLVGRSDLSFTYFKEKEVISMNEITPAIVKRLIVHELEVYTCKDLIGNASKRRILKPVQLIYECTEISKSIYDSLFNVLYKTGMLSLVVSHRDVILIKNVIEYQNKMISKGADLTNALNLEAVNMEKKNLDQSVVSYGDRSMSMSSYVEMGDMKSVRKPISYAKSWKTAYTYNTEGLNVLLVDDTHWAYSPLLNLVVNECIAMAIEDADIWSFNTKIGTFINYYNPIVNYWEPLLELFAIEIEVAISPSSNPNSQISVRTDSDLPLNLTFTEMMGTYFFKVLESWNTYPDSVFIKEMKDIASPLAVRNDTGCVLLVEKSTYRLEIPPGGLADYQVDSALIRDTEFSKETINVFIMMNGMRSEAINGISINKVHFESYNVLIEQEQVPINISVELYQTRKLLIVSSPVTVVNETTLPISMVLRGAGITEVETCTPGTNTPVPLIFYRGSLAFTLQDYENTASQFYSLLTDIIVKRKNTIEILSGDCYFLIFYKRNIKKGNKIVVHLRSPHKYMNRMPCDIRLKLFYDKGFVCKDIVIKSGEDFQDNSRSINTKVNGTVTIPEFLESSRHLLLSKKTRGPKTIALFDKKNLQLNLELFVRKNAGQEIVFYPAVAIINNSETPLSFFCKTSGSYHHVPGQNYRCNIIPCNHKKRLALGLGQKKSKSFKINTIGVQHMVEFVGEQNPQQLNTLFEFIVGVQLTQVLSDELLFTKVVTISPRFVLINELPTDLLVKQHDSTAPHLVVPSKTRTPYYFADASPKERMTVIKEDGQDIWNWSGPFSISNLGTFTVQCKHLNQCQYRLIKVDIKLISSSVFVVLELEDERYCSYRIVNNSQEIKLKVHQTGFEQEYRNIPINSSMPFAWTVQHHRHILSTRFWRDAQDTGYKYKFNFDKINQHYPIDLGRSWIYVYVFNQGSTKVIEFTDFEYIKAKDEVENVYQQCLLLIPKFGISIIEYSKGSVCELLYLSLNNIRLEAQKLRRVWQAEFSIETLQIDNQISSSPIYPILLYQESYESRAVFQLSYEMYANTGPNSFNFESCEILMQTLCLKLESSLVRKLMGFVGRIFLENRPVYLSTELFDMYKVPTWKHSVMYKSDKNFYFAALKLCPIKIICSFLPTKEQENEETIDSFATVASALGTAIITLDAAPIKLSTIEINDLTGSQWQVVSSLWMHYKAQLATEILSLIGHAVVLGNPIGLFSNLGTGLIDFFYEPAQGMIRGPISAGKGFLKGTTSLVTNTVEGTFGTFSKLASSLATGIATLTQTRDYNIQRQRDQAINKPKNLVDGLGMGFKALFTNIGKAISGVVMEPIKGYKRKKMKGLLIGGAIGVSGLFIKPVAGALDAASRTAEGIKNTARGHANDETLSRRPPRCFYGPYGIVKPYNEHDALVLQFVSRLKKGTFSFEKFVGQCVSKDTRGQVWVLAIFMRVIVVADVRTIKVIWIVDTNCIKNYRVIEQGVLLRTTPSLHKKTKGRTDFLVPFKEEYDKVYIVKKIKYMLDNLKNN